VGFKLEDKETYSKEDIKELKDVEDHIIYGYSGFPLVVYTWFPFSYLKHVDLNAR